MNSYHLTLRWISVRCKRPWQTCSLCAQGPEKSRTTSETANPRKSRVMEDPARADPKGNHRLSFQRPGLQAVLLLRYI